MTTPEPLSQRSRRSELALRIASALVLAPLALAVAYVGSWPFVVFWGLAALGILWEWTELVAPAERRSLLSVGGAALVLAVALAVTARFDRALIMVVMGAFACAAFAPRERRAWAAGGVIYAGVIAVAPALLRFDDRRGFALVMILFAVVWATDIAAYFAGRAIGGPKLMPAVSPKKTWSGAIGGTIVGVVAALFVARLFGIPATTLTVAVVVALSVASQAGDLFESWVKRRFGAKDASQLIPGHGGLMDRLDGFLVAALLAALVGVALGGFDFPASRLLGE